MRLNRLSLMNFRNYTRLALELPAGSILLQGDNAQGKTNLLEAVQYLATTRSPYATAERQLVNWLAWEREPLPFARLATEGKRGKEEFTLDITLIKDERGELRKEIRLNGVKKRALDVIGHFTAVLFLPEDIQLVTGNPALRRHYLDTTLCQVEAAYCSALAKYQNLLTQRNALLKQLRERPADPAQLDYWDEYLAANGASLMLRRHQAMLELDETARLRHRTLSNAQENLRLFYAPCFDLYHRPQPDYQSPLDVNRLNQHAAPPPLESLMGLFREHLLACRREEIARGVTLVGPHRDDFHFLVNGIDLTLYGSRGQQRTAALALKLAEIELMRHRTGESPILLLDDVMSEFDADRRGQVLALVTDVEQAVLTTTDWDDFSPEFRRNTLLLSITGGLITPAHIASVSPDETSF
jgi:DNA replication and repair protein RecF